MDSFEISTLPKNARIHFIGIGGISMSGLAEILIGRGFNISGSDAVDSALLQKLRNLGAEIYIGNNASNIKGRYDLIVYTAAISRDNEEYLAALSVGALMIDRATLLGAVMKSYKYPITISGTHGKTSTTSMMTHILIEANCDPTISVGGELASIGGNIRVGNSDYFVSEACEYHMSFLKFYPYINVILNIEADHLDYFKDLAHIIDTFRRLVLLTPPDGAVIINADDKNVLEAAKDSAKEIVTCSIAKDADYCARSITFDSSGNGVFDVYERGVHLGGIHLLVPGTHNISNAICAIAAARRLDVSFESIKSGLEGYRGVGRRFETKGEKNGVLVIDDYAHHPTEIKATLSCTKKMNRKNIWCVFQPHTYTRTKALFTDFTDALSCDVNVIVTDIYAAREKDTGEVSSKELADSLDNGVYLPDFATCVKHLNENVGGGDLVITMGAGDVHKVGEMYLNS